MADWDTIKEDLDDMVSHLHERADAVYKEISEKIASAKQDVVLEAVAALAADMGKVNTRLDNINARIDGIGKGMARGEDDDDE